MAERRGDLRLDPEDRRPPAEKRAPERKKSSRAGARGWRWRLFQWTLLLGLWAMIALAGIIGAALSHWISEPA